jgi:DNA modification methylase
MKIADIKPYSKNAKKHTKKQIQQVANSIKEFGMNQAIVVDKNGVIIVGHGRYEACKLLGIEPEIKVLDISEEKANAYRLADNKLNESEWDMDLVIEELKGLSEPMLDLTGFDKDLIIEPDEQDDVVPETPEQPKSKLGDLYELGRHRVLCGDSTQLEAVLALCGDNKVDILVTDPPYNVAYEGKTKDALKIENDSMSDTSFRQFLVDAMTNAFTVMKAGAVFYIWHADSEGYNFRGAIFDIGQKVRQCLIWNKNSMVMGRQDYHWKHEPCLYGWKEGASHLWNSDRTQTTILEFDRPTRSTEHPTMKPVDLIAYQITNNTKGEDIVLDLFLGGGSTLIASEKTGRICYGMELDPKYVDVIVKRYVDYTGNEDIKLNNKTIKWPKTKVVDPQ